MNRKDIRSFISECRKNSLLEMGDLFFEKLFEAETEIEVNKLLFNIQNDGKVKEKFKKVYLFGKRSFITLKEIKYNHEITESAMNFWLCWLLSLFDNELSIYIKLKDQYEKYIIKQDYSNANILLNTIENITGVSLWSTSQKLYLEEQINGFEANKKLLSSLIGQKSVIPIIGILLEGYSSMAEKTMSYMNYEASLNEYKNLDIISDYIEFKLDLEYDRIPICENIIIQLASQISIIDVFEDYLRLIQYKIVYGKATIENIVPIININDNRIFNLKSIMMLTNDKECEHYLKQNTTFYHALDIYTAGNYENAKVELQKYIKDSPDDIQAIILYVKTCINLNTYLDVEDKLINDIYNLYTMQNDIKQIEFDLLMFAKSHYLLSYGCKIMNLVHKKFHSKVSENLHKLVHINDKVITPNFVTMINDNLYQKKYLEKFNSYCPTTVQLFSFLTNNIENLPSTFNIDTFRMKLYTAFHKMSNNCLDETINILEDLLNNTNSTDFYHYEKVCRSLYNAYAKKANFYNMMILVVDSYFLNNNLINRLDLKEIISNIAFTKNIEIKSSICYPIFTYLYDNNDITKHNISYRNFKDYNMLKTPENLLEIDTSKYGLEKVIFFLYHVCTIKIMKSDSSLVRSKMDIEEIRVNILRKLINYNADASKIYFQEMSEIITKKRIRTRAKQFNQSRIYADTESILKENYNMFNAAFKKYCLLCNIDNKINGVDTYSIEHGSNMQYLTKENRKVKVQDEQFLSMESIAFKSFVRRILHEFLKEKNHGLNIYLSTRIRHGFCDSQLTKGLQELHLLFMKEKDDSFEYTINDYWSKWFDKETPGRIQLKQKLSDFSFKIGAKLDEIKTKWFAIREGSNEDGFLDYTTFVDGCMALERDKTQDFNLIYNQLVSIFWDHTNSYLQNLRDKVLNELKNFYSDTLNWLDNEIELIEDNELSEVKKQISNHIKLANVQIDGNLQEFSNALYKKDINYDNYNMTELVNTCKEISLKVHSEFCNVKINISITSDTVLKGRTFPYYVDILIILLNNALIHSGFSKSIDKEIAIDIKENLTQNEMNVLKVKFKNSEDFNAYKKWIYIEIKNNIERSVNPKDRLSKMIEKLSNVDNSEYLEQFTQEEGGSGLCKMYKILKYNIDAGYSISLGSSENVISVTIAIGVDNIMEEKDEDSLC